MRLRERKPDGRIKRSYFGGLRVKPGPTNVALVIILFHVFFCLLPERMTRNISSSAIGRTFGKGTSHFPAFSFRFCLIVLESTFALEVVSLSIKYAGIAPGATSSSTFLSSFSVLVDCFLHRDLLLNRSAV